MISTPIREFLRKREEVDKHNRAIMKEIKDLVKEHRKELKEQKTLTGN